MDHIFLIGDGHRRFAEKKNISLLKSYGMAAVNIRNTINWLLVDNDVDEFTFFCFSHNNVINRGNKNMEILWNLQNKALYDFAEDPLIHENKIKFCVFGEKSFFPDSAIEAVEYVESATKKYTNKKFNLLSGYSGALDLIHSIEKTIKNNKKITYNNLLKNSFINTPFDFVVRTADEKRVSDSPFLPLRYSEFGFIKKYFPEVTKQDIDEILVDYENRKKTTLGK